MAPLAVHIADGALDWPVLAAGFLGAALLALPGLIRVREEEIPRLALMTGAFFVAVTAQAIWERFAGRKLSDTVQTLWVARPVGLLMLLGMSALVAAAERRWEHRPGFPLGCLLGIGSVLMTVALLAAVLLLGMPGV